MANIKVFGHKSPDTDSTCSAIFYAWYLTEKMNNPATPYIAGAPNKETTFALEKLGVQCPETITSVSENDQTVIVDTTNPDELIDGIENAQIVEIVDHHKLGGLTSQYPLKATIRPVGCSATVIFSILKQEDQTDIPPQMASLLLTAIISDTLNFTSPTTTEEDKQAAKDLQKISGIDVDKYADELFTAKSDLTGMTAKDVLLADAKELDLSGKKVLVAVHETTNPKNALAMKNDIISEMNLVKTDKNYDGVFFFIVDILNAYAEALPASRHEKEIIEKAFSVSADEDSNQIHLPGIVSRKKQIVPSLENALK